MKNQISFEEKIDYIYKELKSQKRGKTIKLLLKLIIIGIIIVTLQSVNKEQIINSAANFIGDISKPITQDIINDMMKNQNLDDKNITKSLIDEIKIIQTY